MAAQRQNEDWIVDPPDAASQVHGGQLAAGFVDGSVRLYDIRTPEMYASPAYLWITATYTESRKGGGDWLSTWTRPRKDC
ncbi:hypothetical protein Ahy_A04g018894 isoform E [Arachis hypogaea]|uniref:Uncharacterized protein n=1 Tax=Arachis hypogaea TaxID=3818 RepID=A0A445DEW1_ARAHY|nr:hypothetical protein Ahy_A04g018894 isoform E [Arachis hypogaea]